MVYLSVLVFLPLMALAVTRINDTGTYKPCFMYSRLPSSTSDQVCFLYLCYPNENDPQAPLTYCKKGIDCRDVDGTSICFKQSRLGICISEEDYEQCESHKECEGRGGKCCGDYCCNEKYFEALQKTCCEENDETCKVRHQF